VSEIGAERAEKQRNLKEKGERKEKEERKEKGETEKEQREERDRKREREGAFVQFLHSPVVLRQLTSTRLVDRADGQAS